MLEADGALTTVLLTFFGIPVSFLLSLLSLYQFKRAYVLISLLSQKRLKNSYWRAVRPYLKNIVSGIEAAFGPAQDYKPTADQVIMVALTIVIIVAAERVITALNSSSGVSKRTQRRPA
ncbi:g1884 [Coccomyxa viridis]|uniref:G1884 protein n=1 Tax=Coccomyxa viridis TaxID=1274662 RepID=A0ABP1FPG9_9CHLO